MNTPPALMELIKTSIRSLWKSWACLIDENHHNFLHLFSSFNWILKFSMLKRDHDIESYSGRSRQPEIQSWHMGEKPWSWDWGRIFSKRGLGTKTFCTNKHNTFYPPGIGKWQSIVVNELQFFFILRPCMITWINTKGLFVSSLM